MGNGLIEHVQAWKGHQRRKQMLLAILSRM